MANPEHRWMALSFFLMFGLAVSLAVNAFFVLSRRGAEVAPQSEFVFSWGSNSQRIMNGTFVLTLKMWIVGQNLTLTATANDDEYDPLDYLGLAFDSNQNGHIDIGDQAIGLWADNYTVHADLLEFGLLGFAQTIPVRGPQDVVFDTSSGYTFAVQFPFYYPSNSVEPWFNPSSSLIQGWNQLHVCFYDDNGTDLGRMDGVFSMFNFELQSNRCTDFFVKERERDVSATKRFVLALNSRCFLAFP